MLEKISANPVYEIALSYQKTAGLVAAAKLDIFTILGERTLTSEEIADQCRASKKGVRVLCDFLAIIGLLMKSAQTYSNVPIYRKYLDRSLKSNFLNSLDFLAAPEMISLVMDDPVKYVIDGGSEGLANVAPSNPIWTKFAEAMIPFAAITAKLAASKIIRHSSKIDKILDVAAGHGFYGIELARYRPKASVVALDWQEVLISATNNAIIAGIGDRYNALSGSIFEIDFGKNYDAILLPNILHHFDFSQCCRILTKTLNALAENGNVFIIDFIPDDTRLMPPEAGAFAYWMLATTPGGDAYTLSEYQAMAENSGLLNMQSWSLFPTPSTLVSLSR